MLTCKPLKVIAAVGHNGVPEYHIVDKNQKVYAVAYDIAAASMCCDVLNKRYPVG